MNDAPAPTEPAAAEAVTPTENAAAGLETLAADKAWQADFNGDNGRPAQIAAVKLKADTTRAAFDPEPDTPQNIPTQVEDGLAAPDAVTQAAAEAMVPAQDASEYTFKWENSGSMEIGELKNMDTTAKESAFAVNANPAYARATLEAMDRQLAKPEGSYTPTTSDALDDHLQAQLGDQANATLQAALATMEKMPPDGQAWLQNSLSKLDTSTAAWVVQRLASVARANN
jgi:hypothetical protein